MLDFIVVIGQILDSTSLILSVITLSLIVKIYLLVRLIPHGLRSNVIYTPWFFLLGILIGSLFQDFAWVIHLMRELHFSTIPFHVYIFVLRISWGFLVLQYQALALFIESLPYKKFAVRKRHILFLATSSTIACYFFYQAFFDIQLADEFSRQLAKSMPTSQALLEIKIMRYVSFYLLHILIVPSIIYTLHHLYAHTMPRILYKQIKIILIYLLAPFLVVETLLATKHLVPIFRMHSYATSAVSTLLLSYALYFCVDKILGLRFLNFDNHVQSTYKLNFTLHFKNLLEQLSHIHNVQELKQLTQSFFQETFRAPIKDTRVYIRGLNGTHRTLNSQDNQTEVLVENFLNSHPESVCQGILSNKILLYDEISFSNFYESSAVQQMLLTFLESINAHVFLPIYDQRTMIGYIIIERNSDSELYGNIERDEMIVFARYIASIINLLQNRNLKTLLYQEKELSQELYRKHQEIKQYKESIRSFLRISQDKEIGIIFYKNRRFVFGNQIAHSLIHINPNTHDGHPLTKVIKQLAHEVTAFQSSQKQFATDAQGNKLVLLGVPSLESSQSIIIVYRPEISDIITRQIDQLYNPTEWDYLLYLETTQSGKLINQLIPGAGETLLNFKVSLLKIALSGSAILLELPENDVQPTVELIHHISLRTELSVLDLKKKETGLPISMKLFGVNPLFEMGSTKPLLEQLDKVGTLFIKNVELLDLETQQLIAEFIKYGEFRLFKGEKKKASNVRMICSTHQNLGALVTQGRFSKELFDELNKTSLAMPSLTSLSEQELNELTDGFTQQALKTNEITPLYQLTSREKNKIMHERPLSLHDLKLKIEEILHEKSTQDKQYEETDINPALETDDPDVMRAVNYGKKALKDRTMMKMLWKKFKNQNKIAAVLSVNRSSVNRRCKEYGLH